MDKQSLKYSPELTTQICELLKKGNNRTDACLLADVSVQTFYNWMDKVEFVESIKKAEAFFKDKNIAIIQTAAAKSWQAAAWLLERKYKDEYGLKINTTEHSKEEQSQAALNAAASVLKLMEEASRNANTRRSGWSDSVGLEKGNSIVQAESAPAPSV